MEATGRRRKRDRGYVQIQNSMFQDERLSYKAKGILGYLLTKPDGWKVKVKDLMKHGTDGDKKIRSGLKELQTLGYLHYFRTKGKDGKFNGIVWEYDDVPYEFNPAENVDAEPFEPDTQNGDVDEFDHNPQKGNVENAPVENAPVENRSCISNELNVTKKDFNNFDYDYQSIILPNVLHVIEKVYGQNISDDRLIDIVNSYYVFHEKITVLELGQILRAMRDSKNKINNVEAYLYKSFANAIRQSEIAQIQSKEPIRKELEPDWLEDENNRLGTPEKHIDTPEEIEAKKKEIEEILKEFRKK